MYNISLTPDSMRYLHDGINEPLVLFEDTIIPPVSRQPNSIIGSLPEHSVAVCMCVCLRGGEGAQTRAVEKIAFSGCTQAELCGSGPDKYVYTVNDLCTLILLCQVETTSRALLQAWLAPLVPALCVCIVRAQILLTSKLLSEVQAKGSLAIETYRDIGIKLVEWHYSLLAWLKTNETTQQGTGVSPWYEGSCHKRRHQHAEAFSNVKWISIDLLAYDLSMWQTSERIILHLRTSQ